MTDLHYEYVFNPVRAISFGMVGLFRRLHGTSSAIPRVDSDRWRAQRDRQPALIEASERTGIPLTIEQPKVIQQTH